MDTEKLEDSVGKGQRAKMVFDEPIIKNFFNDTEKTIVDGIKGSAYEDKEGRENLYRLYRTLDSFKKFFERYIAEGKIASDMLERVKSGAFDNL